MEKTNNYKCHVRPGMGGYYCTPAQKNNILPYGYMMGLPCKEEESQNKRYPCIVLAVQEKYDNRTCEYLTTYADIALIRKSDDLRNVGGETERQFIADKSVILRPREPSSTREAPLPSCVEAFTMTHNPFLTGTGYRRVDLTAIITIDVNECSIWGEFRFEADNQFGVSVKDAERMHDIAKRVNPVYYSFKATEYVHHQDKIHTPHYHYYFNPALIKPMYKAALIKPMYRAAL